MYGSVALARWDIVLMRGSGEADAGVMPRRAVQGRPMRACSQRHQGGFAPGGNWAGFPTRSWRPYSASPSVSRHDMTSKSDPLAE